MKQYDELLAQKLSENIESHERLARIETRLEILFGDNGEGLINEFKGRLVTLEKWVYRASGIGALIGSCCGAGWLVNKLGAG